MEKEFIITEKGTFYPVINFNIFKINTSNFLSYKNNFFIYEIPLKNHWNQRCQSFKFYNTYLTEFLYLLIKKMFSNLETRNLSGKKHSAIL